MRDLQNRCEKVVELEIALDENTELMRSSLGSKSQQQKMAFLERNLEQLTKVQKQLVEQNATIKKDFSVAERRLATRNERITKLEDLLQEAQTRLELQNQKFDSQVADLREKLKEAQSMSRACCLISSLDREASSPSSGSWLYSSRIAKPLRGGVTSDTGKNDPPAALNPAVERLAESGSNKRSSWYVNLLGK